MRLEFDVELLGNEWIRSAATGDSNAMIIWILVIAVACGGIITSIIMLVNGRNEKKQPEKKDSKKESEHGK